MFKPFLVSLLILNIASSQCTTGCIKCLPSNTCALCDFSASFTLTAGICTQFTPPQNCILSDQNGVCLKCNVGFVLDTQLRCSTIPTTNIITGCVQYTGLICSTCNSNTFLKNNACTNVATQILNCSQYDSFQRCQRCNNGFLPSFERTFCQPLPTLNNCSSYSTVSCNSCASGFRINFNSYLLQLFGNTPDRTTFTTWTQLSQINGQIAPFNTCFNTNNSQNCVTFDEYGRCSVCNPGFYLIGSTCTANPQGGIPNCLNYSSFTTCIQCLSGFRLDFSFHCVAVDQIPFCASTDPTSNQTTCISCSLGYYLIGPNSCVSRTIKNISNCAVLSLTSETCLTCSGGFVLTSESLACFQQIQNCASYSISNSANIVQICVICNNGFYLNDNSTSCIQGNLSNCLTYQFNANICTICINRFYISNGKCLPHSVIPNCNIYSQTTLNLCNSCQFNSFQFKQLNACAPVTPITNCDVYQTKTICQTCLDGFFLSLNICNAINIAENCLQKNGNFCVKCLTNYILQDGVCKNSLDIFINNCEVNNINGILNYSQMVCNQCNENSIPVNYLDSFYCVDNNYLTWLLQNNNQSINSNCLQYKPINNVYLCVRCVTGFVVSNGVCVASCTAPGLATLYRQRVATGSLSGRDVFENFYIDSIYTCGTTITNCSEATANLVQIQINKPSYSCIQCNSGSVPVVNMEQTDVVLMRDPADKVNIFGLSAVSMFPGFSCTATNSNISILGNTLQGIIPNCLYYNNFGQNIVGCVNCAFGFNGVPVNLISRCATYSSLLTCINCQQGFFLSSQTVCAPVIPILNCAIYLTSVSFTICSQCSINFFLNQVQQCQPRINSLGTTVCVNQITNDDCNCLALNVKDTTVIPFTCRQNPQYCLTGQLVNGNVNCVNCDPTISFFNGQICILGTVANCAQYSQSPANTTPVLINQCSTCFNQFFLSTQNGITNCNASSVQPNCVIYSQTQKNSCTTCSIDSLRFQIKKKCSPISSPIQFCQTYASPQECKTCINNYRVDNLRTRCLPIPTLDNCISETEIKLNQSTNQYVASDYYPNSASNVYIYNCNQCRSGFVRGKNLIPFNPALDLTNFVNIATSDTGNPYQCFNVLSFKRFQCSTNYSGTDEISAPSCPSCNSNFFPIPWSGKYMCLEKTYFSTFFSPIINISNCERLSNTGGTVNQQNYVCEKCIFPFFLDTTNSCVMSCVDSQKQGVYFSINTVADTSPPQISFTGLNKCQSLTSTGCAVQSQVTKLDLVLLQCARCLPNFIPLITFEGLNSFAFDSLESSDKIVSPLTTYPTITCQSSSTTIKGSLNIISQLIDNCKYYSLLAISNNFGCVKCRYGFTGKLFSDTGSSSGNKGFINSCYIMTTCDPNSSELLSSGLANNNIDVLSGVLTKYFSCLRCSSAEFIPYLFVSQTSPNTIITDLLPYNQSTTGITTMQASYIADSSNQYEVIRCLPTSSNTTNGLQTILSITNFPGMPLNCSLGIVNTASDNNAAEILLQTALNNPKAAVYCTSCAADFSPTYMNINKNIIVACTSIPNCTPGGTWMNACEKCIHYYDTNLNTIDYTRCVSQSTINTANCFAAREDSKCAICNIGFDMTSSGICVQEIVANCLIANLGNHFSTQWNGASNYPSSQSQSDWFLRMLSPSATTTHPSGCNKCSDHVNFILTQYDSTKDLNLKTTVCTTQLSVTLTTDQNITNCINFGWSIDLNKPICTNCSTNFILTAESTPSCTSNANLANCSVANEINGTFCNTCLPNFINVGGVCGNFMIPNCLTLTNSIYKTFATCSQCKDQFILAVSGFTCLPILSLPNCAAVDSNGLCIRCNAGFVIIPLVVNVRPAFCYPIGIPAVGTTPAQLLLNDPTCTSFDMTASADGFLSLKINCLTCSGNNFPVEITDGSTFCYKFVQTSMPGCISYTVVTSGSLNSDFKCISCDQALNFWYNAPLAQCVPRTLIANCSTYDPNNNACISCYINFSLQGNGQFCIPIPGISSSIGGIPNAAYYSQCNTNNECDNPVYQGLPSILNTIVSCHQCKDLTHIPLISSKFSNNNIIGIQEFSFNPLPNNKFDTGSGEFSNKCVSPRASSFGIDPTLFNFPSNCAMAIINANSIQDASNSNLSTGVDRTKIAVMCVACPPGFAATKAFDIVGVLVNFMVAACTQIQNCESSTWFNRCSQCSSNFSYLYVVGQGISYDQCISFPQNQNCFAVDSNNRCWFCQKGYYLNKDLFCELIQPPRCFYSTFRFNIPYTSPDIGTGFFASRDGIGCQQCDNGFTGLYANTAITACTQSPYHFNKMVLQTSMYIFGCKNYLANNGDRMSCAVCYPTFVLTRSGICVSNAKISNCVLAQNENFCIKCLPTFINISRKCVPVNESNCVSFYYNSILNDQICQTCAPNFYLENNVCIPGTIQFCHQYSNRKICNQCQPGYALTIIAGITSYCFPIVQDLNCSAVNLNQFGVGNIDCTTCVNNTFIISTDTNDFFPVRCMPIIQQNFCESYNITRQLGGSQMNCIQCNSNSFINKTQNSCMKRSYNSSLCAVYNKTSDSCVSCITGFFIDNVNKTLCNSRPNGMWGCQNYVNLTTCSQCLSGFFMNSNSSCTIVPDGQLIPGCQLYGNVTQCLSCQNGFYQSGNQCILANAKNCLTYISIDACASCPADFGFEINGRVISCIQKGVQNCVISSNIPPFACSQCQPGYYALNGICTSVTTLLNGCRIYPSNNGTCQSCLQGFILAKNQTCVSTMGTQLDQNCADYSNLATPICNSCTLGNYFSNGVCVPCSANLPSNGCMACDPRNNSICLTCLTGFSQNVNGTCILNPSLNSSNSNTTFNMTNNSALNNINGSNNSNSSNGTTKNVSLLRNILSILFMLFTILQLDY